MYNPLNGPFLYIRIIRDKCIIVYTIVPIVRWSYCTKNMTFVIVPVRSTDSTVKL